MRQLFSCAALAALGLALLASPSAADGPIKNKAKPPGPSYEVPYSLTIPKHVVVRAKINGKGPFNFILDTGAPALFVAVPVCKKLGIKGDANNWGTFDRFEIEGGVVIEKLKGRVETPFQLEGMNGMGLAGVEVHGMIGYNVLAKYRMTIDFTRDKMIWTPLDYKPVAPMGLGGKGGAPGGLEMMGNIMKLLGGFMGRKAAPDTVVRGFLGVTLADEEGGEYPVVKGVLESGPAAKAGLKAGDKVLRVNTRGVYNVEDVLRMAGKVAPGDKVTLTVQRDKEKKDITFTAGEGI